ncbi:MAG: site-specific integrase [Xanthobacteraceae bacterium]
MAFLVDTQELKPGLVIFRRADVKHRNWYCRVRLPNEDRYKTVSLKTADIDAAKERAFDQDADVRFRIKHDVPIFNHPFSQIAKEYVELQERRLEAGQIAPHRVRVVRSVIQAQLNPYCGSIQITLVGHDRWLNYPVWRQKTWREKVEHEREELKKQGKDPKERPARVSDASIRSEMEVFRSIMRFAASKRHIPESHVFRDKISLDKVRREEFTPEEYRKLHTFARGWIKQAQTPLQTWYRTLTYNLVLIMCNTGMRPTEAKNLRWRDVGIRTDKQERKFVVLNVRGKKKHRNLVAAGNVADYLERVRAIAKAAGPDDFVFTTFKGKRAGLLYRRPIEELLAESGLRVSSSGSRRSAYCFRHTYATFRLSEGVDVYFLANQMGTSVKMIEDHYGHITPVKNAERILQGLPGWEPIAASPQVAAEPARVNADAAKTEAAKRKSTRTRDT